MNVRIISLLMLSLTAFTIHAQIGAKVQQKNSITGVWHNSQYGYQMSLILNEDGTGEFDGESLTFGIKDDKLTLLEIGEPTVYIYKLEGNSLLLSGGDLEQTINFTREGSQVSSESNKSSISLVTNSDIVGIWAGNGETIEFKPGRECIYLGRTFDYQASEGFVWLRSTEGLASFQYSIQGDKLTMTINNNSVSYTRGKADSKTNQANIPTGTGQVAQELVGKWCFTNVNSYNQGASSSSECVTLNADGTYIYHNESSRSVNTPDFAGGTSSQTDDRGTWYVQGDRLYVHSQTIGDASYKLEKRNHPKNVNDPMIVLDGRTFVTAYNKPPWR